MPDTYYYYTDATQLRLGKWKGVTVANLDETQLADAAKLAHDRINAVLAAAYTVPFSLGASAPAMIAQIAELLTIVYSKQYTGGHSREMKGPWKDFEDRAEGWLADLASGKLRLPELARKTVAGGLSSTTLGESRTFQSDNPHDWAPSANALERIADDRHED
jgi:hypothetical protein